MCSRTARSKTTFSDEFPIGRLGRTENLELGKELFNNKIRKILLALYCRRQWSTVNYPELFWLLFSWNRYRSGTMYGHVGKQEQNDDTTTTNFDPFSFDSSDELVRSFSRAQ